MRLFPALLAAGTTFAAPLVLACDCAGLSLDQAVKNADVVFTAEAVEVSATSRGEAKLHLERLYKGKSGAVVLMVATGDNCTFTFEKGQRYLVFARAASGGKLQTSICTRTAKKTEPTTAKDIEKLEKLVDE